MISQLVTSFIASSGFGIIFNVPKNAVLKCGFVGMIGWLLYFYLVEQKVDAAVASFFASFAVGIISHIFAKIYKNPVIIFIVGGIIPLVPGGLAYDAMRNLVGNENMMAVELSVRVLMIAGAIALGVVFSEVFNQLYRDLVYKLKLKKS